MKFFREFKEFAVKGNMFEMAIGIIIGVAFNKIVTSLVQDIIMPAFGLIVGKVNFQTFKVVLQEREISETGAILKEMVSINYGNFIQVTIDFLIIALTIFVVVKAYKKFKEKAEDEKNPAAPTPKDIALLAEIRDILKGKEIK